MTTANTHTHTHAHVNQRSGTNTLLMSMNCPINTAHKTHKGGHRNTIPPSILICVNEKHLYQVSLHNSTLSGFFVREILLSQRPARVIPNPILDPGFMFFLYGELFKFLVSGIQLLTDCPQSI